MSYDYNYNKPDYNYNKPDYNYNKPDYNYDKPIDNNYDKPDYNYDKPIDNNYNKPDYNYDKPIDNNRQPEDIKDIPLTAKLQTKPIYDEEGRMLEPAHWLDDPNQSHEYYQEEQPRRRGR